MPRSIAAYGVCCMPVVPPVSVGVPVYNGAAQLHDCLANLAAQDFSDLEIVVCDNASTDATPDICADWARRDARFRHLRQPQTVPPLQNFREVFAATSGGLFLWRAHDDLSSENYVSALVGVLRAHPAARLAVAHVQREREDASGAVRDYPYAASNGGARLTRILAQLARGQASWFYGLWQRDACAGALTMLQESYRDVWAGDHLAVLCQAVNDGIRGTNDAVFRQRLFTISGGRTYDGLQFSACEMRDRNARFAAVAREAIASSALLGPIDRTILRGVLPFYVADRVHSVRRIWESQFRANEA
jgi:glycosyltransferase involved in cell wall biosynthesis